MKAAKKEKYKYTAMKHQRKKTMPDYPSIINPNLLKDANHCTLSHCDKILRGPPCSKSLDQALDHQV